MAESSAENVNDKCGNITENAKSINNIPCSIEISDVEPDPEIHVSTPNADSSIAIDIQQLVSNRLQDSSPDDEQYHELKTDFLEEIDKFINDKFALFSESRKNMKSLALHLDLPKEEIFAENKKSIKEVECSTEINDGEIEADSSGELESFFSFT